MNAPHSEPLVLDRRDGAVLQLVLNRPSARNALSEALMSALQEKLDSAAQDRGLRVIVVGAAGSAFCAGHDLREMTTHRRGPDAGREAFVTRAAGSPLAAPTPGVCP